MRISDLEEIERKEVLFALSLFAYMLGLLSPILLSMPTPASTPASSSPSSLLLSPEKIYLGLKGISLFAALPAASMLFSGWFSIVVAFSFGCMHSSLLNPLLSFLNISLQGSTAGAGVDRMDIFLIFRNLFFCMSGTWLGIELSKPMRMRVDETVILLALYMVSIALLYF